MDPTTAPAAEPSAPAAATEAAHTDDVPSDAALETAIRDSLKADPLPAATGATPGSPPSDPAQAQTPSQAAATAVPDLDARIAAYTERQADHFRQLSEAKAAREAAEGRMKDMEARMAALETGLREDPLKTLEGHGWDFEALGQVAVGAKRPESVEMNRIKDQLKKLESETRAQREAREAAERTRSEADAVERFKAERVRPAIAASKDTPYLAAFFSPAELEATVFTQLDRGYRERGQIPETQTVLRELEAQVKAKFESVRAKVTPAATTPTPPASPKSSGPARTLTNRLTQTQPAGTDEEDLTDEGLTRRAIEFAKSLSA